jgi:hypothetical protein
VTATTTDPDRWYYAGERRNTYTDKLSPGDINETTQENA